MSENIKRCKWAEGVNDAYIEYHDTEWGVPVYDDRVQFEFLILEGAQAGPQQRAVAGQQVEHVGFDSIGGGQVKDGHRLFLPQSVQPPDPLDKWQAPPFDPQVRDGRVYCVYREGQEPVSCGGRRPCAARRAGAMPKVRPVATATARSRSGSAQQKMLVRPR